MNKWLIPLIVSLSVAQTSAQIQRFDNVKYLMPSEDGAEAREVPGRLTITENAVQILRVSPLQIIKTMACSQITAVTYSFSKHRRWRAGLAVAAVAHVFAAPLFFMKGKKHWLTFETDRDRMTLRLDKQNYEKILVLLESQTGLRADRITED